jgi:hypothetical protein
VLDAKRPRDPRRIRPTIIVVEPAPAVAAPGADHDAHRR